WAGRVNQLSSPVRYWVRIGPATCGSARASHAARSPESSHVRRCAGESKRYTIRYSPPAPSAGRKTSSPRYPGKALAAPLVPARTSPSAPSSPGLPRRVTVAVTGPAASSRSSDSQLIGYQPDQRQLLLGIEQLQPVGKPLFVCSCLVIGH